MPATPGASYLLKSVQRAGAWVLQRGAQRLLMRIWHALVCHERVIQSTDQYCFPRHPSLRSNNEDRSEGGLRGRVHAECAWPQVLLRELEQQGSALRGQTQRRLTHAIAAAPVARSVQAPGRGGRQAQN